MLSKNVIAESVVRYNCTALCIEFVEAVVLTTEVDQCPGSEDCLHNHDETITAILLGPTCPPQGSIGFQPPRPLSQSPLQAQHTSIGWSYNTYELLPWYLCNAQSLNS